MNKPQLSKLLDQAYEMGKNDIWKSNFKEWKSKALDRLFIKTNHI